MKLPRSVASIVVLLASQSGADATDLQDLGQLRTQRKYAMALEGARALTDPVDRAREVLETRYHAGDLAGALAVGLTGLSDAPEDLWLLWRCSRLSIDMAAAPLAMDLTGRLVAAAAVLTQDGSVSEDTRSFWSEESQALQREASELAELRSKQALARRRAQWSVLVGLGLLIGAVGWGLQRSGPAQQTGRARV